MANRITSIVADSLETKRRFFEAHAGQVQQAAEMIAETFKSGGKLLVFGNGGSAADAQHLAGELVNRFLQQRKALPAIALTTDGGVLTCIANDTGFESWGAENAEQIAQWVRQILQRFRALGDDLQAGQLNQLEGLGPQCHVALVSKADNDLCVGFHRSLSQDLVRVTMNKIAAKWAS